MLPCKKDNFKPAGGAPKFVSSVKTDPNRRKTEMGLIRNYREWRRTRETVNELSRLTNRELQDLGISRSEIPFIARQAR